MNNFTKTLDRFDVLALLIFLVIGAWCGYNWINWVDANRLRANTQHIQECKNMSGHPVLYWHRGYGTWFLESCKL